MGAGRRGLGRGRRPRVLLAAHEIENFLIEPAVVAELFRRLRADQSWAAILPATPADAEALLLGIAGPLTEDHAAQLVRVELRNLAGASGLTFAPGRPGTPAARPAPGRAEWQPALAAEAARLCGACTATATLPGLQPHDIARRYDEVIAGLVSPAFTAGGEFLREMGGKELLNALAANLRTRGAPAGLTADFLADELLAALDRVYTPGITFQPDDFRDLADILRPL